MATTSQIKELDYINYKFNENSVNIALHGGHHSLGQKVLITFKYKYIIKFLIIPDNSSFITGQPVLNACCNYDWMNIVNVW